MHKKNLWLVIALVAVLVVVAGVAAACGSSAETTTTAAPSGPTTTAAGPTTTAAGPATTAAPAETTTTAAAAGTPVDGGTLRVRLGEPSFIDPSQVFESEGIQVDQALFDGLAYFDFKTNELKPDLATSWEVSSDGLTWTFHLRKDSTFSNGRGVVAGDFKYAWTRLSSPAIASGYQNQFSMVKGYDEMQAKENPATELTGVVAVDDYTLQVNLKSPFPDFPYLVAMAQAYPIPKEEVEKDPKAWAEMPIGNGAFKMSEPWSHNQYIKVVKRADYAGVNGVKPHIDGIDFKIYKDDPTAYLDFQAGNLDYCALPTGQYTDAVARYGKSVDGFTGDPGTQVLWGPTLGFYEVVINTQNSLFKDNPDLRQAFSLAINRQAIVDTLYDGTRQVATSCIPIGTAGYEEGAFKYAKYDVEAAKAALAKAGYPDGKGLPTIPLSFNNNADHGPIMQLVQADLKAIGVNTTLDGTDAKTYWAKARAGGDTFFIGRSGWIADYPSIDNFTYYLYYSEGGNNYSHLKSAEIDKAILDARSMIDPKAALAAMQASVRQIGDFCPDIAVMYYSHYDVTSDKVHNFVYSPLMFMDFNSCWVTQ
jgi:oligopeptide transport system substrate-binding protein